MHTARVRYKKYYLLGVFAAAGGINTSHAQTLSPPFLPGPEGVTEFWVPTIYNQYVFHTTPGVTLRYTTNGLDPVEGDPIIAHTGFVQLMRGVTTFKARAWANGLVSDVATHVAHLTGNLSAGQQHSLFVKSSRALHAAGLQTNGRLGNGYTTSGNWTAPGQSQKTGGVLIGDATHLAAGATHSVYRANDGYVWAFGSNGSGELGDTTTTQRGYADKVQLEPISGFPPIYLNGATEVSAGVNFSGALYAGGVYTWGSQSNHRLGSGSSSGSRKYAGPVKKNATDDLTGIYDFDLGDIGGLARSANSSEDLSASGNVWAWGGNTNGQLGTGNTTTQAYATKVKLNATTDLTDAWEVSQGTAHSAIVRWKDGDSELAGSVWCMGLQTYGRLGNNVSGTGNTLYPVKVVKGDGSTLLGVEVVSAGPTHTLALDNNGEVWAWGYNGAGALGDGTTTNRLYAVKVQTPILPGEAGYPGNKDLTGVTQISAGGSGTSNFSLALTEDGSLYAWGSNANGQLGNGTTTGSNVATRVTVNGFNVLPTPPDATLSASVTQAFYPGAVTLSATVSDPDGSLNIEKVEFYDQGVLVGTRTYSPWSVSLTGLTAGAHHTYAIVTDRQGNTGMSLPEDFVITP